MVDMPENLDERDLLAAELVLGLLEGADLAAALRLRLSDRGFAETVEQWEMRFAPLFDEIPSRNVPDHVWESIDTRLDSRSPDIGTADGIPLVSRLRRWRMAAVAAGTIAASLMLALIVRPDPVTVPIAPAEQLAGPQVIAQLSGEQETLSIATRYDRTRGELNVSTRGISADRGAPVLWVIPADGTPRALGILPVNRTGAISVDPGFQTFVEAGSILAVTMEDPESAPFAAPTTPVIASGTILVI